MVVRRQRLLRALSGWRKTLHGVSPVCRGMSVSNPFGIIMEPVWSGPTCLSLTPMKTPTPMNPETANGPTV